MVYDHQKLRNEKTGNASIGQYDSVISPMRILRNSKLEVWICYYRRVDFDPYMWVSFNDWCKGIEHFLEAGEAFRGEDMKPS